jgi:hypothetical protein
MNVNKLYSNDYFPGSEFVGKRSGNLHPESLDRRGISYSIKPMYGRRIIGN